MAIWFKKTSRSLFAIMFLLFGASGVGHAASYMVPQTYDNIFNQGQSLKYATVKQSTATLSTNSFTIGDVITQYRCIVEPKITCRSAAPRMNAVVSEINLKDPTSNETLNVFGSDIRVEADATNFYVCAAAYGGISFDDFSMSVNAVTAAISYEYKGNSQLRSFVYFTGSGSVPVPMSTSATSYMTIQYQQTCQ